MNEEEMVLKKILSGVLGLSLLLGGTNFAFAKDGTTSLDSIKKKYTNATVEKVTEDIITISGEDTEKIVAELLEKYKEEGEKELISNTSNNGGITTLGASICTKECSDAFRYDQKDSKNVYATSMSQVQGYHWNNGKVHWTSVAGSGIGKWTGSGTAQWIKIDQKLAYSGVAVSISWPAGFSVTSDSKVATYNGEKRYGTNVHAVTFNNGSASSWISLGKATLDTTTTVRSPQGYDYRTTAVATID